MNAVASIRRRCPLASPIQRARNPASPAASARSTCSSCRRCSPSARRERLAVVEEDVDPDPRVGAADPRHVAQRAARRPGAGRGRRSASEPAWLRRTLASTCGRWLVTATRRSWASGSIATGRAPSDGDEAVHASEPLRRGRRGRRQEPGRALEQLGRGTVGAARLGAADRMPADEARVVPGGGADGPLRRADVGDRAPLRRAVEHLAHRRAAARRPGRRTRTRSASATASARPAAGSTAPRSGATREVRPDRDPSRRTLGTPARRAASAADAPISPVPTTASAPRLSAHAVALARDRRQRHAARISSATRNARSSDWRALRRGSQSVS